MSTTKHPKTKVPSDKDLVDNPMIGAGKGTTMAHALPDDVDDIAGENTFEGDVENDTNPQGGIDKRDARGGRPLRP